MAPPTPPTESQILTSYLLHPAPLSTICPYSTFTNTVVPTSARHNAELKRLYRELEFQRDIVVDDVRRRIETECRRSGGLVSRLARQIKKEEACGAGGEEEEGQRWRENKKRKRTLGDTGEADREAGQDAPDKVEDDNEDEEDDTPDLDAPGLDADHPLLDASLNGGQTGSTLPTMSSSTQRAHTTETLLSALTAASGAMAAEVASLEAEIAALRAECEEKVGALSDLRYGRFATPQHHGRDSGAGANASAYGLEEEVISALGEVRARLDVGG